MPEILGAGSLCSFESRYGRLHRLPAKTKPSKIPSEVATSSGDALRFWHLLWSGRACVFRHPRTEAEACVGRHPSTSRAPARPAAADRRLGIGPSPSIVLSRFRKASQWSASRESPVDQSGLVLRIIKPRHAGMTDARSMEAPRTRAMVPGPDDQTDLLSQPGLAQRQSHAVSATGGARVSSGNLQAAGHMCGITMR